MKSILQSEKGCYMTADTSNLHKHHIFGGSNRKWSEKYGLWVWLRCDWHNLADYGVHFNKQLDVELKEYAQTKFEEVHGTREDFMRIFGRNFL
jgi:hypothetical protein